jgi:hypothetical protein
MTGVTQVTDEVEPPTDKYERDNFEIEVYFHGMIKNVLKTEVESLHDTTRTVEIVRILCLTDHMESGFITELVTRRRFRSDDLLFMF